MDQPDDLELKKEIQAISSRINRILKKVKQHDLMAGSEAHQLAHDTVSTETICHPNKTPDQEA